MTITYRDQLSRDLTPAEVDANFRHVIDSANSTFAQSGSGAIARDLQGKVREIVSVTDFMSAAQKADYLAHTLLVDVTDAFQKASNASMDVYAPPGWALCNSAIVPTQSLRLHGAGTKSTIMVRNFSGASGADALFEIGPAGNGSELRHMVLKTPTGVSGGALISAISTTTNVGLLIFEGLDLTTDGTDTHAYDIYIDGSLATAGSIGARTITVSDCHLFGSATRPLYIKSAVNFNMNGGSISAAGGTATGLLEVTGDATVNSFYVNINVSSIVGGIVLDRAQEVMIKAGTITGDITNTSTVTDSRISYGSHDGTKQYNWLRSSYDGPGHVNFPAAQVSSSNVNTLDDYEEGTWTPVFTFTTPGDLALTYSFQSGTYTKIGNRVILTFRVGTSAFTHTTASGAARITGLPFAVVSTGINHNGALQWRGITKADYTDITAYAANNSSVILLNASGSGQTVSDVAAADMPTGGTLWLEATIIYQAAT